MLENKFTGLEIHHVVCDNNVAAYVLSKLGYTNSITHQSRLYTK